MEELLCDFCGEPIEEDDEKHTLDDGSIICSSCYEYSFRECEMCGKVVPKDDLTFWGDCQICKECLDDQYPKYDVAENEKETTEAYEETLNRLIGRKTMGLELGDNFFSYDVDIDNVISYSFYVTIDEGERITYVSRLSAEILLSEGTTTSDRRDYPIDPCDYEDILEYELEDHLVEDDDDDEIDQ